MSTRAWCARPSFVVYVLLVGCGDPMGELVARLNHPDAEIRLAASRAAAELPETDDRIIAALAKTAEDTDAEVRRASIYALGDIGPRAKSSLPAIKASLRDPTPTARLHAALAIQKIDPHDPSVEAALTSDMRAGDGRTMLAVGAMGDDAGWAVPTLIELLKHDSAKIRALAAQTLGRIGPVARDAEPALKKSLQDPHFAVQTAAQNALNHIRAEAASQKH